MYEIKVLGLEEVREAVEVMLLYNISNVFGFEHQCSLERKGRRSDTPSTGRRNKVIYTRPVRHYSVSTPRRRGISETPVSQSAGHSRVIVSALWPFWGYFARSDSQGSKLKPSRAVKYLDKL